MTISGIIRDGGFGDGLGGSLTKLGTGTLILSGENSYTGGTLISAGTLQVGEGGGSGSLGTGPVVNNGTLIFNRGGTLTVPGVISGPGGVTQNGSGNVILTGANTYTGPTNVNSGTLSVNGSLALASVVIVAPGATVGGTGRLGSLTVGTGGFFAPGNSIGTVTLAGNLTLTAGSTTVIEVEGATNDRANVAGVANVAGALQLVPLGGTYNFNAPYTIIQAEVVNGNFASVSTTGSFGAGITPTVSITATEVRLTLAPGILVPTPPVVTPTPPVVTPTPPVVTPTPPVVTPTPPVVTPAPPRVVSAPAPGIPGFLTYNLRATATALDAANRAGGNLNPFFNV